MERERHIRSLGITTFPKYCERLFGDRGELAVKSSLNEATDLFAWAVDPYVGDRSCACSPL